LDRHLILAICDMFAMSADIIIMTVRERTAFDVVHITVTPAGWERYPLVDRFVHKTHYGWTPAITSSSIRIGAVRRIRFAISGPAKMSTIPFQARRRACSTFGASG